MRELNLIYGIRFLELIYDKFYRDFIDEEIALDTDDLNCKVQLAEELPEIVYFSLNSGVQNQLIRLIQLGEPDVLLKVLESMPTFIQKFDNDW